jgi:membrane protein implicated in regulation of membrane protease activity
MFNAMSTPQVTMLIIWIIVVVLGIIIEESTSSLVSIWFSISAGIALVFAIADFSIYIQLAVFAALSLILIVATRPFVKKMMLNTEVRTNVDKLYGMVGIVKKTIEPDDKGVVKVDFQEWTAISFNNKLIEENTKVVIKGIVGNKLIVDVVEEIEIK